MHGLLPKRLNDAVLDSMTNHQKLALAILNDDQKGKDFARLIIRLLIAG
jgi:type I restriction enzyme R subunit